jgi:hypothetical protein
LPAQLEHIFLEDNTDLWDLVVQAVHARKLSDFLGLRVLPEDPRWN